MSFLVITLSHPSNAIVVGYTQHGCIVIGTSYRRRNKGGGGVDDQPQNVFQGNSSKPLRELMLKISQCSNVYGQEAQLIFI
ncbi:hypothetical protein F5Y02DRAFT_95435 [Annulohypoxylon stygium]|nr:hypothetical protein F5Y02DRAFT_95435 [Annulohypoxylon stygium]